MRAPPSSAAPAPADRFTTFARRIEHHRLPIASAHTPATSAFPVFANPFGSPCLRHTRSASTHHRRQRLSRRNLRLRAPHHPRRKPPRYRRQTPDPPYAEPARPPSARENPSGTPRSASRTLRIRRPPIRLHHLPRPSSETPPSPPQTRPPAGHLRIPSPIRGDDLVHAYTCPRNSAICLTQIRRQRLPRQPRRCQACRPQNLVLRIAQHHRHPAARHLRRIRSERVPKQHRIIPHRQPAPLVSRPHLDLRHRQRIQLLRRHISPVTPIAASATSARIFR